MEGWEKITYACSKQKKASSDSKVILPDFLLFPRNEVSHFLNSLFGYFLLSLPCILHWESILSPSLGYYSQALSTTLIVRGFCALWVLGNVYLSRVFIEQHQGSRVITKGKIASRVYKKNLWLEMTLWISSLQKSQQICEYIYMYVCIPKFIESCVIGVNKYGKKPNRFVDPINKISDISIRVQVCPL